MEMLIIGLSIGFICGFIGGGIFTFLSEWQFSSTGGHQPKSTSGQPQGRGKPPHGKPGVKPVCTCCPQHGSPQAITMQSILDSMDYDQEEAL